MSDEYTSTPTHIRCYEENGEWFVDAVDIRTAEFTDPCWSYDTQDEALRNVAEFVSYAEFYLFAFDWPTDADYRVGQRVWLTEDAKPGVVAGLFDDGRFLVQTGAEEYGTYAPEFMTNE